MRQHRTVFEPALAVQAVEEWQKTRLLAAAELHPRSRVQIGMRALPVVVRVHGEL